MVLPEEEEDVCYAHRQHMWDNVTIFINADLGFNTPLSYEWQGNIIGKKENNSNCCLSEIKLA